MNTHAKTAGKNTKNLSLSGRKKIRLARNVKAQRWKRECRYLGAQGHLLRAERLGFREPVEGASVGAKKNIHRKDAKKKNTTKTIEN
jgi:hypothetical protein